MVHEFHDWNEAEWRPRFENANAVNKFDMDAVLSLDGDNIQGDNIWDEFMDYVKLMV